MELDLATTSVWRGSWSRLSGEGGTTKHCLELELTTTYVYRGSWNYYGLAVDVSYYYLS